MTAAEEQIRDEQALNRQKARLEAYKRLFATDDGKIVLADLVAMYDTEPPLVIGDPHGTHYAVGQQAVVKGILKKLNTTVDQTKERTT